MEAVRRLHEVADLPGLQREGGALELGHHRAPAEVVEIAAVFRVRVVLGVLPGQLGEVGARPRLLEDGLGLRLHVRVRLPVGLEQDVAGADPLGGRELRDVVGVVPLNLGARHLQLGARLVRVEQHEPDRPPLGLAVALLVGVEVGGHVRVGHRDVLAEVRRRDRHHLELHLAVPAGVLLLQLGVRDRHPLGQPGAQLLDDEGATQVLLELGGGDGRPLHLQQLPVALLADEAAVFLQRRDRQDARAHLLVGDREPEPRGFRQLGALLDHLLQHHLTDLQLADCLLGERAAVGRAVRVDLLLIPLPEVGQRDRALAHARDTITRRRVVGAAQEVRDVEDHEGQADKRQAPLEPALVPPHPVEHRHGAANPLTCTLNLPRLEDSRGLQPIRLSEQSPGTPGPVGHREDDDIVRYEVAQSQAVT